MSVYDRNEGKPGLPPNWWLYYVITEELALKFKRKDRRVREPAGVLTEEHAQRVEKDRKRQVRDGSWQPFTSEIAIFDHCMTQRLAACEQAKLSTAKDIRQRLTDYILPKLTGRAIKGVGKPDIEAVMREVQAEHPELAPRTIIHIYEDMRMVFQWACDQDPPLLLVNPCKLKRPRGKASTADTVLPRKRDKNPRWRRAAKFEVWEIEVTIGAPLELVPIDRLVFYVTEQLTGSRVSEVCALRVSDYDRYARPLPRLHIIDQGEDEETGGSIALKGGGNPRECPVHPILWDLLDYWLAYGFPALLGRPPQPDDFLIPSRKGPRVMRSSKHMYKKQQADLQRLGLRPHQQHDARRGFISMLGQFKCDERVVKAITHEGVATDSAEVFRNYQIHNWDAMCEEMFKVHLNPRPVPERRDLPAAVKCTRCKKDWSVPGMKRCERCQRYMQQKNGREAAPFAPASPYAYLSPAEREVFASLPPLPRSTRATAGSGEAVGHRTGHSSGRGLSDSPEITEDFGRGGRGSNLNSTSETALNGAQQRNEPNGAAATRHNKSTHRSEQATAPVALLEPALAEDLRAAGDAILSGRAQALTADWRQRLAAACARAAELLMPPAQGERDAG